MSNLSQFAESIDNSPIGYGRFLNVTENTATVQYKNATYLRSGILVDPDLYPLAVAVNNLGEVWTKIAMPSTINWSLVAYGNGVFVSIQNASNICATSPDGITWTQRTLPVTRHWDDLTFGNGLFVVIGSYLTDGSTLSKVIYTSPNGITWTNRTFPSTSYSFSKIFFCNGMFFIVLQGNNANFIFSSPDGITWTQRTMPASLLWKSISYGNGVFVAVAKLNSDPSNIYATSPDGITWTQRAMPVSANWWLVAFGKGLFVAVVLSSNIFATSSDGITWTQRTLPVSANWVTFIYANGIFVLLSEISTDTCITSKDGINWTIRIIPIVTNYFKSIAYGDNTFVAVSANSGSAAYVSKVYMGAPVYTPNLYFRVA